MDINMDINIARRHGIEDVDSKQDAFGEFDV